MVDMDKANSEPVDRPHTASMKHEVKAHDPAPLMSHIPIEHPRGSSVHGNGQERPAGDVWTSAISRLQAQVSYNTGMLDSHRRQFNEIEAAVGRLQQQLAEIVQVMGEVQRDLRVRPDVVEHRPKQDPSDLEVLATQMQRFTNRISEVDGLNMQVDLLKNRMKRLEDGAVSTPGRQHRQTTSSQREATFHHDGQLDATRISPHPQAPPQHVSHSHPPSHPQQLQRQQQQQQQQQQQPPPPPPPPPQQQQHAPLPPIRTNSMASPGNNRRPSFPGSVLDTSHPASGSRPLTGDQAAAHPPPKSLFRSGEALPPPSALSSWRPAESAQSPTASQVHAAQTMRFNAMEVESHAGQHGPTSAWAPSNPSQALKRHPEDRASPYGSPSVDGAKRPRLAPLMPNAIPRNPYGEEGFAPSAPGFAPMSVSTSDVPFHPRSRAPSDGPGSQFQPGSTPTMLAAQHSFRFVTSAQQSDSQEQWRGGDADRPSPSQSNTVGTRGGRGKGSRGGRARGRGRGGAHGPGSQHDIQERGTPEYERPEFSTSHAAPSGFYTMVPQSPKSAARGAHLGPLPERMADFPATPGSQIYDPRGSTPEAQGSGSKKTRTKPIRNAEGILIRKDGRPDMRSVSSANNLRKVHAKKEAERTGEQDGEAATNSPGSESMMASHEHPEDGDGNTRHGTPTDATAGNGEGDGSEHRSGAQDSRKENDKATIATFNGDGLVHEEPAARRDQEPGKSDAGSNRQQVEGQSASADADVREPESQSGEKPGGAETSHGVAGRGNLDEGQPPAVAA